MNEGSKSGRQKIKVLRFRDVGRMVIVNSQGLQKLIFFFFGLLHLRAFKGD